MALDLGTLRAGVEVDQSEVPRGLAGVRRRFMSFLSSLQHDVGRAGRGVGGKLMSGVNETLDRGVRGISGILGGGAKMLAGFGAAGLAAIGAVAGAGAMMGIKVASGAEQARIAFTTMLDDGKGGGAKAADKFLRQLADFAAKTPFEFPELQTAASSLISAGIEADRVIPIMTTLGNVTSGMGTGSEGVRRATIALQQMSAAGRITGEDLNQLRDAGIPVYDLLAAATGKSKEEVVKLAQAGKLGKRELGQMMEALESGKGLERFSGLMEEQSKSLAGLWSSFKDVFQDGLARIVKRSFPTLKAGLGEVTALTVRMFKWFDRNREAIGTAFGTAGRILRSFGRIAKAVLGGFIGSLTDGRTTVRDFAEWLETNQGRIVGTFVAWAGGAIQFGLGLARVVSGALRGFAGLADGVETFVMSQIHFFGLILSAATQSFGWLPGIGPQLKAADEKFRTFASNASAGMGDTGRSARGMADKIDNSLIPALQGAQTGLDKVGKAEIWKAQQRDAAARAKRAIDNIGTSADGSQIKLKTWNDRTKLGARAQKELQDRIHTARQRMIEQWRQGERNKVGQEELTKRWDKGKEALYREFRQMKLSETEAKRLADQYGKIPGKKETKVSQPGMPSAIKDTGTLDRKINDLNGRKVTISYATNAGTFANAFGIRMNFSAGTKRFGGSRSQVGNQAGADTPPVTFSHGHGPESGGPVNISTPVHGRTELPDADTLTNRLSQRLGKNLATALGKKMDAAREAALASSGAPGGTVATVPGRGWGAIQAAMRRHGARSFTTYPGHHPTMERARDVTPHNWAAANAARALSGVWYVIYRMRIASKSPGKGNVWRQYHPSSRRGDWQHVRHIHVARYGEGTRWAARGFGWTADKGAELVVNPQLRRYSGGERVYTHRETKQVLSGRGALVGGDLHVTARSDRPRDVVAELMFALRTIEQGGTRV